jgi:hypothetical protein
MSPRPDFDDEADLVARMRAAGFTVRAATRDYLPPPEHTIPPKHFLSDVRAGLRRFSNTARRPKTKHAAVP